MTGSAPLPSVGIIGVGSMGLAIAEKLIGAGFETYGYRRSDLAEFIRLGGHPCVSGPDLVARTDLVILLLPTDHALIETVETLVPVLRESQILICLSSHPVEVKWGVARLAQVSSAILLDGEISGTAEMIRSGFATVMLAGDPAGQTRALPILLAFAAAVEQLKQFGDAVRMKLLANYLVGANTLAVADALAMAERKKLDLECVVAVLARSAGTSRMLEMRGPMMARGDAGTGNLSGYLKYFANLRSLGGASELLNLVEKQYAKAVSNGAAQRDLAAVFGFLR